MVRKGKNAFLLIICLLVVFFGATGAQAVNVIGYEISQTELQHLPEYLQTRILYHHNINHSEYQKWARVMGPDYAHLHHFAIGLVCVERAKGSPPSRKGYYLKDAKNQYGYVIGASRNLPVLHVVYAKRGDVNFMLANIRAAVLDYTMAMKLKPDSVYAYLRLSECYSALGMKQESMEILKMMENVRPHNKSE